MTRAVVGAIAVALTLPAALRGQPAALLIACLEFLLLFNLLIFAEKNRHNKIAIIMIALLASYQSMES